LSLNVKKIEGKQCSVITRVIGLFFPLQTLPPSQLPNSRCCKRSGRKWWEERNGCRKGTCPKGPNSIAVINDRIRGASNLTRKKDETPKVKPKMKKQPRTATIVINCSDGNYADIMRQAKTKIKPEKLGVKEIRPRRTRTDALLLEIPGAKGNKVVDA